jgi:hypothetical protein
MAAVKAVVKDNGFEVVIHHMLNDLPYRLK